MSGIYMEACLPVNKQLRLPREVIVNDVIYERYVNATGGNVSRDEDTDFASSELRNMDFARRLHAAAAAAAQAVAAARWCQQQWQLGTP
jgi:hypothetical protein